MHYVVEGSGPLIVLLHGFPEFWWSWRFQISPLVEAGYRVVVMAFSDFAFGRSGLPRRGA